MRPRQSIPPSIIQLAAHQAGVLSAAQLTAAGVSDDVRRRLRREWTTIAPKLYLIHSPTWESAAWAGLLRGGASAVISGAGAAYLHKFLRDPPASLTVWTDRQRGALQVAKWRVDFRRGPRAGRGTPPRTAAEAALWDLADESDETTTVAAFASALANRRTTAERLQTSLRQRRSTGHLPVLTQLLTHANTGIESALEWRFHARVLEPHRLATPRRQASTHVGRVDGIYDDEGIIVELDGMRDHTDWSKDMWRDNEHALQLGAVTLRYGWWAVELTPCAVATQLASALSAHGWKGAMTRCPGCPEETSVSPEGEFPPETLTQPSEGGGRLYA
ncbi:hypothetical protein H5399_13770 [Tessaracoccus sp. MC1627]|uniref:hypothetical protein n=1 Tax=Tessaracoccus sp. MC1627 TaxID=2760312 RepID=UPI0016041244|nr:hypothetical protein [Tessaracoccus sp. MC1627]MBB1513663.1 hypothetical protein [Tessaracoccus sp. MC1627]